jgi:lambda family phage minor tail protein L
MITAEFFAFGFFGSSVPITAAQQLLEVGNFIELFTLDATPVGGGIEYWTPNKPEPGTSITWRGQIYTTIDIMADGFEKSTSGTLPRPQLSVGNADNVVGALLTAYGDAVGLVVTRTRTLQQYLDGQPDADPDAEWPVDIFRVERKVSQNKRQVSIEIAAATDNEGAQVPAGFVIRDLCPLIYRRLVDGEFEYAKATCPYAGSNNFDILGNTTDDAGDQCGKRVSDCKLRFGANAQLPFGGFPGVARVRM